VFGREDFDDSGGFFFGSRRNEEALRRTMHTTIASISRLVVSQEKFYFSISVFQKH